MHRCGQLDASALEIVVKKSFIPHSNPVLGLFVSGIIGKGDLAGCICGTFVCSKLSKFRHLEKTFGEGVMQPKLEIELLEKIMDKDWIVHKKRIVLAPFCIMRYTKDIKYLLKNTTRETESLTQK